MAHDHDSQTRPTFEYRTCDQCVGVRAVPVLGEERMQVCPKCKGKGNVRVDLPPPPLDFAAITPEQKARWVERTELGGLAQTMCTKTDDCALPNGHPGECDEVPF